MHFSFYCPDAVLTVFLWMVRLIGVQVQPTLQGQKLHKDRVAGDRTPGSHHTGLPTTHTIAI